MSFPHRSVILITQTIIQSHVLAEFPLVLRVSNVVLQFSEPIACCAVVEWAWFAHITQVLNGRRLICQKVRQIVEHVSAATEPVCIETIHSDFGSEF